MNLNDLSRALYRGTRLTRDLQAVRRGRLLERLINRVIGRLLAAVGRRLYR